MDVVSHGLWGGAPFYAQGRKKFLAAVFLGMAPDLLSFGVFHVMHPGWLSQRLVGKISGPPALTLLPPYVFHAYNITHSLVVWAVAFFLLWLLTKKPPWLLGAWLLHILCDIPTHAASYFPTPFLRGQFPIAIRGVFAIIRKYWEDIDMKAIKYYGLIILLGGMTTSASCQAHASTIQPPQTQITQVLGTK
jgi:membrane-bound metal-dependent hydrolase YbcI (DUF457 family)